MPPETIAGRYDVVREVGRGGMGAVWLCTDRTLGREVAVKQVGGLPGESTPHLARALREARSSAALNHPHVVSIFDAIEDGGHVWLVMEYLPSRTLSQVLRDGPLDVRRAAHLGAQVAEGLAAAHARGVVHRDVKPGNILVTDADVAKISDFGIARTLGEEQLTQTGMVAGTPLYFSPALARGGQPTPADDVWALGATLYAAVEGEPPWPPQENSIAMLMHIVGHEPPIPRRAGALTGIIRRMMNVDADARPTMAEAAAVLRAAAQGDDDEASTALLSPATTQASTPASTPRRDERPAPAPAPVAAAAPVPVAGEDAGGDGGGPRRRTPVALLVAAAVLVLALGAALLVGLLGDDDADDPATAGDDPGQRSSRSGPPRGSESASPTPTPEETPTEEETTEAPEASPSGAASPVGDGTEEELVEDYYALLPTDYEAAWRVLSPEMQEALGYDSYSGFWSSVDSVSIDGIDPQGEGTVLVDLTYNGSDSETREITVSDGRIVADAVSS
ncbi:serine/threonine-protein kinase [Nocardioides marmotae]|uniref:serine/threonine-protein kinase n=1 Tax=Nocardioides marmotae TaxID=2663857 RepID=UPI0012B55B74|nr:serine/threonine-protein kinase [Nocardioides marmotae]MBC9734974.1 serine/threonine protein kinase [Nocardioides marmotae]MTB86074.1 protein kinase [Nocardioides marmotae]